VIRYSNKYILGRQVNKFLHGSQYIAIIVLLVLELIATDSTAQSTQQEINNQVWKPFIETYNNHDTQGFLAVHSKDVIRSPRDSKSVWNWNEYFQRIKQGDDEAKTTGTKRKLELRFTERIANNDLAVDVGIYKATSIESDGKSRAFYGRFHVALRKENGTWKILVDTDSSERGKVGEKDFISANAME
jgi:ketosteroid isomerase-like protein